MFLKTENGTPITGKQTNSICYNNYVSQNAVKPVLLVKKDDAKKGSLWHEVANRRFIKQHGGVDELPEGDLHAIATYHSPVVAPPTTPEETNAAISDLENQIHHLKEKDHAPYQQNQQTPRNFEELFDDKQR